jgi:2-(1,2-epoxy-1,2-dihydrophenyl)acetyl-CoA isomerase
MPDLDGNVLFDVRGEFGMRRNPLIVDRLGPVALWQLNEPEICNPLSADLKMALAEQAQGFVTDRSLKALVITGSGEFFCAGGDLRSLDVDRRAVAVRERMRLTHSWMKLLAHSDKPVIMAVNGPAVGAGVSLAFSGDIIVASEKAYFMAGFPKVGVLPDLAILYNLPRAIGVPQAKDFLMTNRRVDAKTALSMGMISRVFAHEELADRALEIATNLANGPGVMIGLTKSLLGLSHNDTLETFLLREEAAQVVVFGTEDFSEGSRAFKEKRKPRFVGE